MLFKEYYPLSFFFFFFSQTDSWLNYRFFLEREHTTEGWEEGHVIRPQPFE